MKYKEIKTLGQKCSVLGFGAMRMPVIDNDNGKIQEDISIEMMRYGIDSGINYIDTAYPYHKGNSEIIVGKALKGGYREKVLVVTKSPVWQIEKKKDFDIYLEEQLKRLDIDCIDVYLFHALNKKYWSKVLEYDLLDSMEKAQSEGRIRNIGFSFHGGYDLFQEIVNSYNWDICMLQYNYLDINNQAGINGIKYAKSKGIPIAIMEPLRGGVLINNIPGDIMEIFNSSFKKKSLAEWALGWLLDHDEIDIIISGMSNIKQIKQNIAIVHDHEKFSESDHDIIKKVHAEFMRKGGFDCTSCEYCDICPNSIMISTIFSLYNNYTVFNKKESSRSFYNKIKEAKKDISSCNACKKCEEVCPQNLGIIELLKEADSVLS